MTFRQDQHGTSPHRRSGARPRPAPKLPANPTPRALRRTDTPWQRTYSGTKDHVNFELHIRRHASGLLTGSYRVQGGLADGVSLHGGLRTDGSFVLYNRDTGASFKGHVLGDGTLHVLHFGRRRPGRPNAFELDDLVLTPGGPREPFDDPDLDRDAHLGVLMPTGGHDTWGEAWQRTFTGELAGTTLTLDLRRAPDGTLAGTFDLAGRGTGDVTGRLGADDLVGLDVTYTGGPRAGQKRRVQGTLMWKDGEWQGGEKRNAASLARRLVLRGEWRGGDRTYPFEATGAEPTPSAGLAALGAFRPDTRDSSPLYVPPTPGRAEQDEDAAAERNHEREAKLRLVPDAELKKIRAAGEKAAGAVIGSLDGVEAYYNPDNRHRGRHASTDGRYDFGLKWQCVEFIRRYFYTVHGHRFDGRGNAADYFERTLSDGQHNKARGLTQYSNEGQGSRTKPRHGDLVVFARAAVNGGFGHVAIVVSCSDTELVVAQQNVGTAFTGTFRVRHHDGCWHVMGGVLGWLRKESP